MEKTINVPEMDMNANYSEFFASTTASSMLDNSADAQTSSLLDDEFNINEQNRIVNEHNERVKKSPEFQARVLADQYISNAYQNGIYLTGPQKKHVYKKFLAKAKKGRFNYMFDEEKQRRKAERMQAKFTSLNKPQERSLEELSPETQERLKEMVNEEPWHDLKPQQDAQ